MFFNFNQFYLKKKKLITQKYTKKLPEINQTRAAAKKSYIPEKS
jgi:hypothetical protein